VKAELDDQRVKSAKTARPPLHFTSFCRGFPFQHHRKKRKRWCISKLDIGGGCSLLTSILSLSVVHWHLFFCDSLVVFLFPCYPSSLSPLISRPQSHISPQNTQNRVTLCGGKIIPTTLHNALYLLLIKLTFYFGCCYSRHAAAVLAEWAASQIS
jgi:hypothetical protein